MQAKIRVLMAFAENFVRLKSSTQESNENVIGTLASHFARKQPELSNWIDVVANSLLATFSAKSAVARSKDATKKLVNQWLANEFKKFNMLEANSHFQNGKIEDDHCVSFAYYFLNNKYDLNICEDVKSLQARMKIFLTQHKTNRVTEVKALKPGDLIVYLSTGFGAYSKDEITHVGVYLGRINDVDYVISKLGGELNTFIHPINNVPDHYGLPSYHQNKKELSPECSDKLKSAVAQVQGNTTEKESKAANVTATKMGMFSDKTESLPELEKMMAEPSVKCPANVKTAVKEKNYSVALRRACAEGTIAIIELLLVYYKQNVIELKLDETSSNGKAALDWLASSKATETEKARVSALIIAAKADHTKDNKEVPKETIKPTV